MIGTINLCFRPASSGFLTSNEKVRTSKERSIFDSRRERYWPMHSLGPATKGKNVNGSGVFKNLR
jgi:hypothetical protein